SRRAPLVAVLTEDRRQGLLVEGIEQLRGRRTPTRPSAHAHVERCVLPKRESAVSVVDLVRGDTEIEEDGIEALPGKLRDLIETAVVSKVSVESALYLKAAKPGARGCECIGVAIESDHEPDARLQHRERVAPATERPIE